MKKHLIILEGPAGSGKSTMASALSTATGIPIISSSLPRRTYTGNLEPAALSAINDYTKLIKAFAHKSPTVVIDRMYSQYVYSRLRRNSGPWQPSFVEEVSNPGLEFESFLNTALNEFIWRNLGDSFNYRLDITWVFIIPAPEVLEQQRRLNPGREYHWPAQDEVEMYQKYHQLMDQSSGIGRVLLKSDPTDGSIFGYLLKIIKVISEFRHD